MFLSVQPSNKRSIRTCGLLPGESFPGFLEEGVGVSVGELRTRGPLTTKQDTVTSCHRGLTQRGCCPEPHPSPGNQLLWQCPEDPHPGTNTKNSSCWDPSRPPQS